MKTVKIVPSICKEAESNWEGHIIMRLPTFDEKYEYMEQISVDVDDENVELMKNSDRIKKMRKMVGFSKNHYHEIALKNKVNGEVVSEYDQLTDDDELHAVLVEIAGKLFSGFKVGND